MVQTCNIVEWSIIQLVAWNTNWKYVTVGIWIRGLRSRARLKRDKMRLEANSKLAGPGQDYFFMVSLVGKIREIIGMGLLNTTRESLK